MREILFRGKRYATDEWIEGSLLVWPDKTIEICNALPDNENELWKYLVREESVGQFTGCLDRNGRRIFEGDICRGYYEDDDGVFTVDYKVVWFPEGARWGLQELYASREIDTLEACVCAQCEVLGNIFDALT